MALSSSELSYIRESISGLLPDTCNILELTRTWNGVEHVETWGTATAAVACRLDYISGNASAFGGAVTVFTGWVLTLPHDTTITTDNRVEHGSDTYAVVSLDTDKSWRASVRVRVEQI